MKKQYFAGILGCAIFLFLIGNGSCAESYWDVRAKAIKDFPHLEITGVRKTPIPGLYELETGPNLIYYYPDKGLVVFGEIWNRQGKSLTGERRQEITAKKAGEIPLARATLTIGSGKNTIIEFTDPGCPYCRKAAAFLKGRKDVTRYIFFLTQPKNPKAGDTIAYILCAQDRQKAYEEVMEGKPDKKGDKAACQDKAAAMIEDHRNIASAAGVRGTPAFWINGAFVSGANIPGIEALLDAKNKIKGDPK